MELDRRIYAPYPAHTAADKLAAAWRDLGYTVQSRNPLAASRGSLLGSLTGFSPTRWLVRAEAQVHAAGDGGTAVHLRLHVNTTGQRVTAREMAYWEHELDRFQAHLASGAAPDEGLRAEAEQIRASGWRGVKKFAPVALGVGIPAGIFLALIDPPLALVGLVAGLSAGFSAARKEWGL